VSSEAVYFKGGNHEIFLIHDIRYGLIPFGIAIPNVKSFLEKYDITAGMELIWQDHELYFPDAGIDIVLDEKETPASNGCKPDREAVMRKVAGGTEILKKCGKGIVKEILWKTEAEGFDSIYMKKAFAPLQKLESGMKNEDAPEIHAALCALVGLGPGLTPSLDDFLTAVIAACKFIERSWKTKIRGTEILADQIMQLAQERTGEFSAAYLTAAAEGGSFSLIEDLICAEDAYESRCERLLAVGGNSGADLLTGVAWSFQYILNDSSAVRTFASGESHMAIQIERIDLKQSEMTHV
jgi:hypothetical protein